MSRFISLDRHNCRLRCRLARIYAYRLRLVVAAILVVLIWVAGECQGRVRGDEMPPLMLEVRLPLVLAPEVGGGGGAVGEDTVLDVVAHP